MSRKITEAEFNALCANHSVTEERDGEFAYDVVTDDEGREIAFASYRAGKCEGYTLAEIDA